MKKKGIITLIAGVVILAAAGMSVTVTAQNEYKLIRQFGKVKRVISSPGISMRLPFLETVTIQLPCITDAASLPLTEPVAV